MFCSQCATKLQDDAVYCPNCAKPVASFSFSEHNVPKVEYIPEEETHVRPENRKTYQFTASAFETKKITPSPTNVVLKWLTGVVGAFAGITLLFVGLIAVIAFASGYFNPASSRRESKATNNYAPSVNRVEAISSPIQTPMPTPVPTPERTQIVNTQFPVNARTYKWFEFTVGSDTRVSGGFRAYGGANDIDTILVDEANRTFYQSGYTSRGKGERRCPCR